MTRFSDQLLCLPARNACFTNKSPIAGLRQKNQISARTHIKSNLRPPFCLSRSLSLRPFSGVVTNLRTGRHLLKWKGQPLINSLSSCFFFKGRQMFCDRNRTFNAFMLWLSCQRAKVWTLTSDCIETFHCGCCFFADAIF